MKPFEWVLIVQLTDTVLDTLTTAPHRSYCI